MENNGPGPGRYMMHSDFGTIASNFPIPKPFEVNRDGFKPKRSRKNSATMSMEVKGRNSELPPMERSSMEEKKWATKDQAPMRKTSMPRVEKQRNKITNSVLVEKGSKQYAVT